MPNVKMNCASLAVWNKEGPQHRQSNHLAPRRTAAYLTNILKNGTSDRVFPHAQKKKRSCAEQGEYAPHSAQTGPKIALAVHFTIARAVTARLRLAKLHHFRIAAASLSDSCETRASTKARRRVIVTAHFRTKFGGRYSTHAHGWQ